MRRAFEVAGVEFIDENGGGGAAAKAAPEEELNASLFDQHPVGD